jgi:sorbitol-specific phosphotransferase system component IIA
MIKTIEPVSFNPVNLNEKAIVFAKVVSALRNDENETYTLNIQEWVVREYEENVPNEITQVMEVKTFTQKKVVREVTRTMTFADADALTNALDQMFTITEVGSHIRKRYSILGHLIINNQENVRNVNWELV